MCLQHGLPTKRRRPPGRYAIPDLTGFPLEQPTSLQIVSCGCYEQSVHALLQGMDAGTPQPQGLQASRLYGTGTDDPGDRNANAPEGQCLLGLGQLTGTKHYCT